jgi:hypothetical protein
MSMREYEERLRPPAPSLHQILAAARGSDRGRRWGRCVLAGTAVLGILSMTCRVVPHHTVDKPDGYAEPDGECLADYPLGSPVTTTGNVGRLRG